MASAPFHPTRKADGMSLPLVASSQPSSHLENKIHFSRGATAVTYPLIIKAKKRKYCDTVYLGVALKQSDDGLKGACYRLICEKLNCKENDQLRYLITDSFGKVTHHQVASAGGFGAVVISTAVIHGRHVFFEWLPKVNGQFLRSPIRLGMCDVGVVVTP